MRPPRPSCRRAAPARFLSRPPARLLALPVSLPLAVAACGGDRLVGPPAGGVDGTFAWSGSLAPGARLSVQNGNGDVDVRASDADAVTVDAVTVVLDPGRDASAVAFGVEESGAGVTVCTLYGGARRCGDPGRPVNVRVTYTVSLPRGRRLIATTGNGNVRVAGASAGVLATTGNGGVTVSDVAGPVVATTGNGEVALVQRDAVEVEATLTAGNGAVTATLPAGYRGRVDATTGNGVVRSDFPVVGAASGRRLSGTVNGGGALLRLTTGNGAVTLRKG